MRQLAIFAVVTLAALPVFAQTPAPKTMKAKSRGEAQAFQAMAQAQDLEGRIKAADDFLAKYADTDFKSVVLQIEADAYNLKNDNEKAIFYAEQALEADKTNYQSDVLLARIYASTTKANDLDKEEKLTKAAKYANEGIEALKIVAKPNAQLSEEDWTKTKNDFAGQCYYALGIVAIYHNKPDEVTANLTKVAEMDTDPTDLVRAGRALLDAKKPDQAVIWFDKVASNATASAQIKNIAMQDKARAQAMIKK